MNLSPESWAKSEVTKKSLDVGIGTELIFIGDGWAESYEVTFVDEDGFTCRSIETGESEGYYEFKTLQLGWEFK